MNFHEDIPIRAMVTYISCPERVFCFPFSCNAGNEGKVCFGWGVGEDVWTNQYPCLKMEHYIAKLFAGY